MKAFNWITIGMFALASVDCAMAPTQAPTVNVTGGWADDWVCNRPADGNSGLVLQLARDGANVTGSATVTVTASSGGTPRSTNNFRGIVSGDTLITKTWTDLTGGFTVAGDRM